MKKVYYRESLIEQINLQQNHLMRRTHYFSYKSIFERLNFYFWDLILTMQQEIIAFLEKMLTPARRKLFKEVIQHRTRHFTVVLEDVFQSYNASSLLRNCEVFGLQEAHFIEINNEIGLSENVSLGAQKWVDIHRHSSVNKGIDHLKKKNYQVIATTPHEKAHSLNDFDISKPTAFLFGTEKIGLSEQAKSLADGYLSIPMVGFTESLNISVAMGIIIQNLSSRLRSSNLYWQLSPEDRENTYLNWLKKSIRSSELIISRLKKNQSDSNY